MQGRDHVHFNRRIFRQLVNTDGRSGVFTGLTQYMREDVRRSIGNLTEVHKIERGFHVNRDAQQCLEVIQ